MDDRHLLGGGNRIGIAIEASRRIVIVDEPHHLPHLSRDTLDATTAVISHYLLALYDTGFQRERRV